MNAAAVLRPCFVFAALALIAGRAPATENYGNMSADDLDPALRLKLLAAVAEANSFEDRFDAEVWMTDMSRRLKARVQDTDERLEILRIVHQQATRAGLPPELVLAVIDVESAFDRYAISSASALGLMQVMPFWVDELGYDDKNVLFDVRHNVLIGCQILRHYLDLEGGDLVRGLARYNGSRGQRWYSDRVIDRLSTRWYQL